MTSNTEDPRPTIDEQYATACSTSNLRVEDERQSAAHILIASAMSPSRLGSALLRLMTEWDGMPKPLPPTHEQIDAMAEGYLAPYWPPVRTPGEPDEAYRLRRADHEEAAKAAQPKFKKRRAQAQQEAWSWYVHELERVMARLKTLPEVRYQMIIKAELYQIHNARKVASEAIGWWLHQRCAACNGTGERMVHQLVKVCSVCHGTQKSRVPNGIDGDRMVGYIDECLQAGRSQIRERLPVLRDKLKRGLLQLKKSQ